MLRLARTCIIVILLSLSLAGCKKGESESCTASGECAEKLVCHEGKCTAETAVLKEKRQAELAQELDKGFAALQRKCAEYDKMKAKIGGEGQDYGAQVALALGLGAGDEVEIEVDTPEARRISRMMDKMSELDVETVNIGADLYRHNPAFREAVNQALTDLTAGEVRSAEPTELDYCAVDLLKQLRQILGE